MALAQQVRVRIASAMAATARLNRICQCNTIRSASKVKFYKSLVTSILLVILCETWTLFADSEKEDQGLQNQMPEEISPHLLLGAQDQRLGAE